MTSPYVPRRPARSRFAAVRGLRCHLLEWGDVALASPARPTLVMAHGWMDVGASFQFAVDALAAPRHVVAFDWRGFGLSESAHADSYWFPDYLGDLDAILDLVAPDAPVDLLGHSMGGNVVMLYAGVRPGRIRRLVNLEGFGMPASEPRQAPRRVAQWLDQLKQTPQLKPYASLAEVAERLRRNNPRLAPDKAAWLAAQWAERRGDGLWHVRGDPAHKRVNPQLYRVDETLECWKRIEAPLLWVDGDSTDVARYWGGRYTRAEFDDRLAVVPRVERHTLADAGHMLHHDQPAALAARLEAFLDAPA